MLIVVLKEETKQKKDSGISLSLLSLILSYLVIGDKTGREKEESSKDQL